MTRPLEVIDVLVCCRLLAVNAVEPSLASAINQLISNPKLSAPLIAVVDMPTMRIRRYWPGESRLGRLAMDLASSVSVPLSAVPPEISRLVLESLMHFQIAAMLGDKRQDAVEVLESALARRGSDRKSASTLFLVEAFHYCHLPKMAVIDLVRVFRFET